MKIKKSDLNLKNLDIFLSRTAWWSGTDATYYLLLENQKRWDFNSFTDKLLKKYQT